MSALAAARRSTSARLAGLEVPACFAEATVAAEAALLAKSASERTTANRRDLARVARKARRVAAKARAAGRYDCSLGLAPEFATGAVSGVAHSRLTGERCEDQGAALAYIEGYSAALKVALS